MTSSEPNVARPPVELAQARVELGRDDRHQHEVVEADREVERGQPRDRDRDQDRNFDERPLVAHLLDRLLGALQLVAGVDDHHDRADAATSSSSSRPPRSKRPSVDAAAELDEQRRDRPRFTLGLLRLRTDDDGAHDCE